MIFVFTPDKCIFLNKKTLYFETGVPLIYGKERKRIANMANTPLMHFLTLETPHHSERRVFSPTMKKAFTCFLKLTRMVIFYPRIGPITICFFDFDQGSSMKLDPLPFPP